MTWLLSETLAAAAVCWLHTVHPLHRREPPGQAPLPSMNVTAAWAYGSSAWAVQPAASHHPIPAYHQSLIYVVQHDECTLHLASPPGCTRSGRCRRSHAATVSADAGSGHAMRYWCSRSVASSAARLAPAVASQAARCFAESGAGHWLPAGDRSALSDSFMHTHSVVRVLNESSL